MIICATLGTYIPASVPPPAYPPPLKQPTNPESQGSLGGFDSPSPADFLTFGLHKGWATAWAWAVEAGTHRALLHYIDVLQMSGTPFWLGTALQELTSPHASALLDQWQADDTSAALLHRLSRAARLKPEIFGAYAPLTRGASGQSQLAGEIAEKYLFAMVAEHVGTASGDSRRWLVAMRMWALVMGLRLERNGNVRDRNLRQIAKGIRLACDRKPQWVSVLADLTGSIDTVDGLTGYLGYRAYQLRKESRSLGEEQSKFLRSIIELAEGRSAPEDPHHSSSISHLLNLPKSNWADSTFDQIELPEDEAGDFPSPTWLDGGSSVGQLALARVRPADSYVQQQSSARSILLLDTEGLHHLPWSWRTLNPIERTDLTQWIAQLLSSQAQEEVVLGILSWIAVKTGRTLHQVAQIQLSAIPSQEWSITPDLHELVRLPPQRRNGWKPSTPVEAKWVAEAAALIQIRIPPVVRVPLEQWRPSVGEIESLADWWIHSSSPSSLFLKMRPPALQRVTPGMLGQVLPQQIFEETADGSLARLLASHPQSGLPGACAYGNWSAISVEQRLNTDTPIAISGDVIGAGSHLAPIESMLRESILQAGQALNQRMAESDWIGFHNAYVTYLTLSLFAATGARPVRDPFEARAHFDLDEAFVFVDDKSSGATRNGRLIPLPPLVVQQVRGYEGYLLRLAKRLDDHHNHLATAIRRAAKGVVPASIPFLFMLSAEDGTLTWDSVSATSIEDTGIFQCPLPLNLFRHRLAQQLRQHGLDPEIIDGLLGHAEFGCSTYGDDSPRAWATDMAVARPHLKALHQALGFAPLPPTPTLIIPDAPTLSALTDPITRDFGIEARAKARRQTREVAEDQARRIIEQFLNGRELTALDENDLWLLSKKLMLSESGMPLPTGYIRYAILMDDLEKAWKRDGKRIRVGRRLIRLPPPPALFTPAAPGVEKWHQQALAEITALSQDEETFYSGNEQGLLAATALCVVARITRVDVLHAVVCRQNYRITVLNGEYDLEYQKDLRAEDPDQVVERYPIPPWLAMLLAALTPDPTNPGSKAPLEFTSFGPLRSLRDFVPSAEGHKVIWGDYLSRLAQRMDQHNAINLPGALAAWYAGRSTSASLGWRDRIRLQKGRPPVFDKDRLIQEIQSEDEGPAPDALGKAAIAIRSASTALDDEALQRASRAFFSRVRALLTENIEKEGSGLAAGRRRTLAADIRRLIRGGNGNVSPATLQLTQWIAALVGSEIDGQRPLKRSTIARYFSALSPMFENYAYAADLLVMDGDDLTELYADMLGSLTQEDTQYTADRLATFHRWLIQLGADTPDWSEMPATITTARRAPGVITEKEYQTAMALMLNDSKTPESLRVTAAFLLLGCYRFGLRGSECLGIRRDDWIANDDERPIVLVQNHPWRQLKSKASRRQVPLLFVLTDQEAGLIKTVLARYSALHGHDQRFPLLDEDAQTKALSTAMWLKRYAIEILKRVTNNPAITLHHARHTAANRIARLMFGIYESTWRNIGRVNSADHDGPHVESTLLGSQGISRRQSWGLSRYLGHAGTHTLWRSYLHIQPEWARQVLAVPKELPSKVVLGVIDLSVIALGASIENEMLEALPRSSSPLDLRNALAFMRLIALGKTPAAAALSLQIDESAAREFTESIKTIGKRFRLSPLGKVKSQTGCDHFEFLRRLPAKTWDRLHDWTLSSDVANQPQSRRNPSCSELKVLEEIVGATAQLVLWRTDHFEVVRRLLSLAEISNDQFQLWRTNKWHPDLQKNADEFGFVVCDPATRARRIQIDSAVTTDPALSVSRRAGLLFKETARGLVRNRIELTVLFLAISVSLRSS